MVVSRPHVRQYGLNGNRSSSVVPSGSSSSAGLSARAAASCSESVSGAAFFVR